MSPDRAELRDFIRAHGSAANVAAVLRVSVHTVNSWSSGRNGVPAAALMFLRMAPMPAVKPYDAVAEFRAELVRATGRRRASGKPQIKASVAVPYLE